MGEIEHGRDFGLSTEACNCTNAVEQRNMKSFVTPWGQGCPYDVEIFSNGQEISHALWNPQV
jgi:hypothetical protein